MCLLRLYKQFSKPCMPFSAKRPMNYYFMKSIYMRFLCDELGSAIQQSNLDPIVVVKKFRDDMDTLLSESENASAETLTFACYMANCAEEILNYLTLEDKK